RTGGVAVGAGDARLEVLADAGVLGLEEGEGVAHRLAGPLVGGGAAGVGVHAVAPLVEEHGRDLTRVGAAAARAVEVHRAAVPEGVAGAVDVHVGGQRAVEPGVARQEARRLAVDVGQMVVAGAGGVGVAGAAGARGGAAGAAAAAEGDVASR